MPVIFGNDNRGCFVRYSFSARDSQGATLMLPNNAGTIPNKSGTSGILITAVNLTQRELVSHLKCFNDAIYTYVFGSDVGDVTINFLAFLQDGIRAGRRSGYAGEDNMGTFATMLECYADGRVSNSGDVAILEMGSNGGWIVGQIVGLSSSTANTETNIQSFQMELKTTKVAGSV